MKKIILFSIIIIVLISVFLLFMRKPKIEITLTDERTIEFLGEKKVSDFIVSINGNITNDFTIDSTFLGKKNVTFDFINDDNRKATYSYEVTIIDTVAPVIWLTNSYSITVRR